MAMIIALLAGAYVALLVLVLCVLTMAKRGDAASAWATEPADPAPLGAPARRDLALADVDTAFVRRFDRGARVPPRVA